MMNDSARHGFCPVCGGHEFVNGVVYASGLQFIATGEQLRSNFNAQNNVEGRVCRSCGHLQFFVSLLASSENPLDERADERALDEATGEPPLSDFLAPDEMPGEVAEEEFEEPLPGEELVRRAQKRPWLL